MTGRHAHVSGTAASGAGLRLARAVAIVVVVLLALAAAAVVFYCLFTGRSPAAGYIALSVFWAAFFVWNLVRRRRTFWPWLSASLLLRFVSQLITELAQRHQWLAGHPHVAAQLSDWTKWTGLALLGVSVVLGIRSGELLFWKRSRPASARAEPEE